MDKINFQNNVTKVNAETFNTFQNNIEKAINTVDTKATTIDIKTLPTGGTTGQILTKQSDTDYDTQWQNPIEVVDNLESTDTTSALSAKQGKTLKQLIEDEIYYKAGDSFSTNSIYALGGYLTAAKKQLWVSVPLPKRLSKITTITMQSFNISARSVGGTYILDGVTQSNFRGSVEARKVGENMITIIMKSDTELYQTNNIPIGYQVEFTVSFS